MRLQTSLGLTVLVSALVASPVYAENCSISYYCYRSMTPGAAPVTPIATSRPNPNASARPNNLQQPRPVTTQVARPQPQTTPARPTTTLTNQRLIEQQRAQTLADQRRLAALGRQTTTRIMPAPPQTTARTSTPTPSVFRSTDNQSCNTLALKIKVLESQATSAARSQQQSKAQDLFKVAGDLRKQAQAKSCVL